MSAWRVGTEASELPRAPRRAARGAAPAGVADGGGEGAGDVGDGGEKSKDAADKITKWIPGEVIAFYAVAITSITIAGKEEPSVAMLVIFALLAPLFVLLGGFSKTGKVSEELYLPAGLSLVAFLIWSITVPASGWQKFDLFADNPAATALIAGVVGLLFCYAADGFTVRAKNDA